MPLPIIADTIRVAVEGLLANGHVWANVLHFRKTTVLSYTGAIAVLDPLLAAHYTTNSGSGQSWANLSSTACSVQRIRYTPLDGSSATTVISHVINGTNSTDQPLPANVALVTTFYTNLRGISNRGRVYMVGFTEGSNFTAGAPSSGTVTAQNTQWNGFKTALTSSGVSHVVASYLNRPTATVSPHGRPLAAHSPEAHDVLTYVTNGIWDTQRKRLRV